MGQVNLFGFDPTQELLDFLSSYRNGELRVIAGVRALEDEDRIHVHLRMANQAYSYALVEIKPPILMTDLDWLYRGIVAKEFEYSKRLAFKHAVERALPPKEGQGKRVRIGGDTELALVQDFRQKMEIPAMALKYFMRRFNPEGHVAVTRQGNVVAIEFEEAAYKGP